MDGQRDPADREVEDIRYARRACRLAIAVPLALEVADVPLVFLNKIVALVGLAVIPLIFLSSGSLISTGLTKGLNASTRRSLVRTYASIAVILAFVVIVINIVILLISISR